MLGLALSWRFGFLIDFRLMLDFRYDFVFVMAALMFLVIHVALRALTIRREGKDNFVFGPRWRGEMRSKHLEWHRFLALLKVMLLTKLVILIYCCIKQAIPSINPKLFDSELLRIDRIIHLGLNPNTATAAMLGNYYVSGVMDIVYVSWYLLKPMVIAYFAIVPDGAAHRRFFMSYFAMWMACGLCAVLLPSLGPVYTHPEWFGELHMPIARNLQATLHSDYLKALADPEKYRAVIFEGIAAFPSLHVGIVALFAFFISSQSRKLGFAMFAYLVLIQFGSVLLGWHYALDGYFTIAMAYGFYRCGQRCGSRALKSSP